VQAAYRKEQFEKVVRYTDSNDCRMAALVGHFGDVDDANRPCGHCDVCDPAGAILRLFRHASAPKRHWAQDVIEALRGSAYKTPKTLRAELAWAESLDRNEFEEVLGAMLRAGLIESEDAEFEKDGKRIPYRKISLTDAGFDVRATTPLNLLFSDGIVEGLADAVEPKAKKKRKAPSAEGTTDLRKPRTYAGGPERQKGKEGGPVALSAQGEQLAARLKEWRTAEAKRLRVPPFLVLHDRTLNALAAARPANPHELLAVEGMGPSKVGRFGEAILAVCNGG